MTAVPSADRGTAETAPGVRGRARWALAWRLARREARRHPWRQALVVLLIFVPVLATIATFSVIDTGAAYHRHQDEVDRAGADAIVPLQEIGHGPDVRLADLQGAPPGVHVERQWTGGDWLIARAPDPSSSRPRLIATPTRSVAPDGRLARTVRVDLGRLPRSPDEIFLTRPLAQRSGWTVGDQVELAKGTGPLRVSGIGVLRRSTDQGVAVLSDATPTSYWHRLADSGLMDDRGGGWWADPSFAAQHAFLWAAPGVDLAAAVPARVAEDLLVSVPEDRDVEGFVRLGVVLAATTLAALVAVVASAAFALGARRQLRTVGLLATAGADPTLVRSTLVLQGVVPGLLAGVAAIAVAALTTVVGNRFDLVDRVMIVDGASVVLSVVGVVIGVAIGVLAGAAAAWMPARATARIPVLSALGGRRPLGPVPHRVPVFGLVAMAVGFGLLSTTRAVRRTDDHLLLTVTAAGGVIGFVIGAVALAPAVVSLLGRVAGRVTGLRRIALRGLARNRTQSAATVAAVAVALALPIALLTIRPGPTDLSTDPSASAVGGPLALDRAGLRATLDLSGDLDPSAASAPPGHRAVVRADHQLRDAFGPDALRVEHRWIASPAGDFPVAVVDPKDAPKVLTPWAAGQLAAGRALVTRDRDPRGDALAEALPTRAVAPTPLGRDLTLGGDWVVAVVTPDLLAGLPRREGLAQVTYLRDRPASAAERDQLQEISVRRPAVTLDAIRRSLSSAPAPVDLGRSAPPHVWYSSDDGADPDWETLGVLALAGLATVVALLVLTITLSLRSVDGMADHQVAIAVGAPPTRLRRIRAFEGVVLTALGALLALPLGWLPVVAVRVGWAGDGAWARQVSERVGPGLLAVPVLLGPVLLAGALWWAIPAVRAAVVDRRPTDQILPRA